MAKGSDHDTVSRSDRIAQQRRALPDSPGVYLFYNADGELLYVGTPAELAGDLDLETAFLNLCAGS